MGKDNMVSIDRGWETIERAMKREREWCKQIVESGCLDPRIDPAYVLIDTKWLTNAGEF